MNDANKTIEGQNGTRNKWHRILYVLCICFFLTDICYSFVQHYNEPLDGDMGESVLPLDYIKPLYQDPTGIKMLLSGEPHAAPNRFFSHYAMYATYRTLPFFLQHFADPIHSLYYTNAICKTVMQLLLVLLLSCIVCGGFQFAKTKYVLSCLFFSALMQTCGFTRSMGLIDPSITYSFFYALPLIFLLFYLLPFILREFFNKEMFRNKTTGIVYGFVFLVLACFSGAINSAMALVVILTLLIRYFYNAFRYDSPSVVKALHNMPSHYYRFLLPLGLLSLYSLFIGSYNTMWVASLSIAERYALLPQGILQMFIADEGDVSILFVKGFGILFALCLINCLMASFFSDGKGKQLRSMFIYFLCFSAIYIALLPFGGYRPYRPYIIRYDSVLPVSCLFILYHVYSSLAILEHKPNRVYVRNVFAVWTMAWLTLFFRMDTPCTYRNDMEMAAIREIQSSPSDTIQLKTHPTSIISWDIPGTEAQSETAAKLLKLWNVTEDEKRFYFPKEEDLQIPK